MAAEMVRDGLSVDLSADGCLFCYEPSTTGTGRTGGRAAEAAESQDPFAAN